MRTHTLLLSVLLSGSALAAQIRPGVFGYLVQGTGGAAGEFCHQFDCTPRPHSAVAGETLRLTINAPERALFIIGASFSATSCLSLPIADNALVLDLPLATLAVGVVNRPSPVLACWGGTVDVPLPLPPVVPSGFTFATQAVAEVPGIQPGAPISFSVAVVTTVR